MAQINFISRWCRFQFRVCWGISHTHLNALYSFLNLIAVDPWQRSVIRDSHSPTHPCPEQKKFPNKPTLSKHTRYAKKSTLRFPLPPFLLPILQRTNFNKLMRLNLTVGQQPKGRIRTGGRLWSTCEGYLL
jgi:hypothetical protein